MVVIAGKVMTLVVFVKVVKGVMGVVMMIGMVMTMVFMHMVDNMMVVVE